MKTKLFEDLNPREILDNLEAENCGIEDNFRYIKPFTEEEAFESRSKLTEAMIGKSKINHKIKALTEPLKEEIKPLDQDIKKELHNLEQGGIEVYGKVYCFPDYEANLMGLYNDEGMLVATRQLSRTERQLHINSFKNVANG
jgi:alpha-tubulin suppressor-like RCC1 family protein